MTRRLPARETGNPLIRKSDKRRGGMAADYVLFIGWNRAVIGREKAALELFRYALQYFN